jgi:hypothetical protein
LVFVDTFKLLVTNLVPPTPRPQYKYEFTKIFERLASSVGALVYGGGCVFEI